MQEISTVELAYVPTVADVRGALRARKRAASAGRLQSGVFLACGIVVLGALVLTFMGPKGPNLGLTVLCLAALALIFGMHMLVPALQARQVHRMVALQGEFRAVVGDVGVRLTCQDSEATFRWPMITRYTETDTLFVLMTPDKQSAGFVALPKLGTTKPEDVSRLRAILDRNANRV